jgi:hypothetical protein
MHPRDLFYLFGAVVLCACSTEPECACSIGYTCSTSERKDGPCDCLFYDNTDAASLVNGVWRASSPEQGDVVFSMLVVEDDTDLSACQLDDEEVRQVRGARDVQCGYEDDSDDLYGSLWFVILIHPHEASMDGWDEADSQEGVCRAVALGAAGPGFVEGRLYARSTSPFGWRSDYEQFPGPLLYFDDRNAS